VESFGTELTQEAGSKGTQEETMNVLMMTGDIGYVENTDLGTKMIATPYKISMLIFMLILARIS
jgi:hypothetical protein